MTTNDPIQPQHYKLTTREGQRIECIDAQEHLDLGPGSHLGNALKYVWRLGRKAENGLTQDEQLVQDVKKARWYIARFHAKHGTPATAVPRWLASLLGDRPTSIFHRDILDALRRQHETWLLLAGNLTHACNIAEEHVQNYPGAVFDVQPWLRALVSQFDVQVEG